MRLFHSLDTTTVIRTFLEWPLTSEMSGRGIQQKSSAMGAFLLLFSKQSSGEGDLQALELVSDPLIVYYIEVHTSLLRLE